MPGNLVRKVRAVLPWVAGALFLAGVYFVARTVRRLGVDEVLDTLGSVDPGDVLVASLFAAGSYLTLTFFDYLGVRAVAGGKLAYPEVALASFTALSVGHVVGLAATGSKTLILEKCFVPEHRIFTSRDAQTSNPPGAEVNKGPLYRVPFFVGTGHCTSVPAVGIGLGACEDYIGDVSGRATRGGLTGGPKRIREFPTIQMRVAEATAMMDAAQRLMAVDSAALYAGAVRGDIPMDLRQQARRDFSFASRLATWAVDLLFEAEGGSGLYTNRRIQRAWRDVHAANAHIGQNWDRTATQYGRYALGLPPAP